ncbi:FecR domain-containing protein [Pseudomonas syringae]|uniref:Iron transporter n=1 Tax=Pseudomonas syringae TaxID=317 RepID=A0A085VIV2_PSESX|nr:FecR domain-containing protein [Pseudomonas syringae]KFE55365.1 iron transporter [Pseudomonas syringae]
MRSPPDREVFEAAASWFVQFQSEPPTQVEQAAWRQWLESDPAHRVAWQQMEQLQRSLGCMPAHLTRRALSKPQQRRQILKLMLAVVGTGYIGWNVKQHTALKNVMADYRTPVGRRQHLELADGSQLELNTDTAIDVVFDSQQRLIRLRDGEVLVRTGKRGDTRPFYVETQHGRIQALGTRFSVRQLQNTTRVGVLEDQVSIMPAAADGVLRLINAGQGAEFTTQAVSPERIYPQTAAAWVDGQLIVLNEPLGNVIQELARYRPGVMQCEEQVAKLRISGSFRLDATDAVLANLQATLPIQVRYFTRYWVSVSTRA